MSKILLLEDSYHIHDLLREQFEELGWEFDRTTKVVGAIDFHREHANDYDCIVVDLMVDPLGLTNEEVNEFHPFFGWAWIRNYLLNGNPTGVCDVKKDNEEAKQEAALLLNNTIQLKEKTIIFSKYVDELKQSKWKHELNRIALISKGRDRNDQADQDSVDKLKSKIELIRKTSKP